LKKKLQGTRTKFQKGPRTDREKKRQRWSETEFWRVLRDELWLVRSGKSKK
jgi:hypothetical protein